MGKETLRNPLRSLVKDLPEPYTDVLGGFFEQMSTLERAKQRIYEREAAQIKTMDGEESNSFHIASSRAESSRYFAARLFSQSQRMRIVEPECDENTCVLHGRIMDNSGAGLKDWIVSVTTEAGNTLKQQRTNELGYFKLQISTGSAELERSSLIISKGRKPRGPLPINDQMSEAPALSVHLNLLDPSGRETLTVSQPITIPWGKAEYQEIIVGKSNQTEER